MMRVIKDKDTIKEAAESQEGFDLAVTIPTGEGPLVLLIETYGHFRG